MSSVIATREQVQGTAAAHGWKLRSMKVQNDGTYRVELFESPMYQSPTGREITVTGQLHELRKKAFAAIRDARG